MKTTLHSLFLAGAIAPLALDAQATPRPMQLRDWYRVTQVSQPAVSPDGKRIAMTVTTVRERENKRHSEIWVVPTAGGEPVRWTSPSTESSNPRWTPDGRHLVFTSARGGGQGNTWVLRAEGGGEATQLPTIPTQGTAPANGAFAVWAEAMPADSTPRGDDPYARMGAMSRPPFDAITRPVDPARYDGRHIVDMVYKSNDRGFVPGRRTARTWRPTQLWTQRVGDTAKVQLTRTAYSHRSPVVSPDGRFIAFVADAQLRPDSVVELERDSLATLPYDKVRDEAVRNDVDLYVVPVAGGMPRKVATWTGTESELTWSPDSRRIAFIGRVSRTTSARVMLVDVAGGTPRNLIGDWRYEPASLDWLATGALQFTAEVGGRTAVLRADVAHRARRAVRGRRRRRR